MLICISKFPVQQFQLNLTAKIAIESAPVISKISSINISHELNEK